MSNGSASKHPIDIVAEANILQEPQERVGESTGRDQAHSECTFGHWAVYGSY